MENTDRELLELAANATCLEWKWVKCPNYDDFEVPGMHLFDSINGASYWSAWNPLTNDGDALRLAVKLELLIHIETCYYVEVTKDEIYSIEHIGNDGKGCLYAATRRAIVRAAAEIGKVMT